MYKQKYKTTPNQSGTIKPRFIILHHSAGAFLGSASWILKSESKVSYHYLINPVNGDLLQFVKHDRKAWHAGKSEWQGYKGLNSHSIGIAFSGDTNKRQPSFAEIDSCALKCIEIMREFGINANNILTHEMIAPGRKNDCSKDTYLKVIERIQKIKGDE